MPQLNSYFQEITGLAKLTEFIWEKCANAKYNASFFFFFGRKSLDIENLINSSKEGEGTRNSFENVTRKCSTHCCIYNNCKGNENKNQQLQMFSNS